MKEQDQKKRNYRKYDKSFKMEAVTQMNQGRSVRELSTSLGVSEGLLYRWKSQDTGTPRRSNEELKQMKRAYKQLEEENGILKKALGIFSRSG